MWQMQPSKFKPMSINLMIYKFLARNSLELFLNLAKWMNQFMSFKLLLGGLLYEFGHLTMALFGGLVVTMVVASVTFFFPLQFFLLAISAQHNLAYFVVGPFDSFRAKVFATFLKYGSWSFFLWPGLYTTYSNCGGSLCHSKYFDQYQMLAIKFVIPFFFLPL